MRSNIARTCVSGSVPGAFVIWSAELREELDERVALLRRQVREGGHRRRRVDERPCDRLFRQPCPDVGQMRTGTGVAVFAELVTRQAARLGRHLASRVELLLDLAA